jgi:hypothetical protein
MGNSSASAERPKDIGSFKKQYEKYNISTAINQVHYGVCHGMCLNWVRKMLLTGPGWRPKKDKDYEARGTKLHTGFQDSIKQCRWPGQITSSRLLRSNNATPQNE